LKDLGLPPGTGELKIIRRHRLAPSFSAYEEDEHGRIDDNGRRLRRIVYRWNGRFYGVAKRKADCRGQRTWAEHHALVSVDIAKGEL